MTDPVWTDADFTMVSNEIELHPDPEAKQMVFVCRDMRWREPRPVLHIDFDGEVEIRIGPGMVMIGEHDLRFVDELAEMAVFFRDEVRRMAAGQPLRAPEAGPARRGRRRGSTR